METPLSVAVIGNTPIGITLASRFMLNGVRATLVGRKNPLSMMNRLEAWHQNFCLEVNTLSKTDWARFEAVFFCLRSYDLFGALDRYLPYLNKGIPIVCLAPGALVRKLHETEKIYPHFRWRIAVSTWKPIHVSSGYYRLEDRPEDRFYWGPAHGLSETQINSKDAISDIERNLLKLDSQKSIQWAPDIKSLHHRLWVFHTVIQGLCTQLQYAMPQELLNHLTELKDVFLEAFDLSQDLWGVWTKETPGALFGDLVAYIALQPMRASVMQEDLLHLGRTESQVFAGMSLTRRTYPKLKKIHEDIQLKSTSKARGD